MFIFLITFLKFGTLLSKGYGGLAIDAEFQLNIFKIIQKRQKTQGHVNTTV